VLTRRGKIGYDIICNIINWGFWAFPKLHLLFYGPKIFLRRTIMTKRLRILALGLMIVVLLATLSGCSVDGVKDKDALFISRQKTRISPKTVQFVVKSTLEKAGLSGRHLSTHKLRHTAATLMYQYGDVDVLAIKEILGHESLSTTQIYTHIMDEQLKNAAASNPLSGIKAPKRPEIAISAEDEEA
jgi:integrase